MHLALVAASVAILQCALPPAAGAQTGTARAASQGSAKRINIAGRQRMLSQRMTKAVCFQLLGIDTDAQRSAAEQAATEFERQLDALRTGSAEQGLAAEANPDVRQALDQVAATSQPLTTSVLQLAAGDLNSVAMRLVLDRNLPTLKQMNAAVGLIERVARGGGGNDAVGSTINLAGRQRMLSQRIAKDACFIAADLNRTGSRGALEQSIVLFDDTLSGLQRGNREAGLLPPPNPHIEAQLALVRREWGRMVPLLTRIRAGEAVETADLLRLAAGMDVILREMNRAVGMWVEAAG